MGIRGFARLLFGTRPWRGGSVITRSRIAPVCVELGQQAATAGGAAFKCLPHWSLAVVLTICSVALFGCATNPSVASRGDPLEPFNRDVDEFNMAVDRAFIEPVSEAYARITPDPIRASITNFFDNLGYLSVVINNLLQGKFLEGGKDAGRFLVNTTMGIGGLFDIASRMNLPRHEEDLGQTLCRWGVPEGPFIMLPLLGPTTVRDLPTIPAGLFTSLLTFVEFFVTDLAVTTVIPLGAVNVVNTRANLSTAIRIRNQALDPYIFTREAYLQRRLYLCYDGNPPLEDFEDLDELDELDEISP